MVPTWAKWTSALASLAVVAILLIALCPRQDDNPTCVLTLQVDNAAHGATAPAGGGNYSAGQTVDIEAVPASGWEFDHWEGDVSDPSSAGTLVMMDGNKTVTAFFVPADSAVLDLTVQDIVWAPAVPLAGSLVTVSVTVKNLGAGAGASDVCFYVDNVETSSSSAGSLAAGATITKQFTWAAQAGGHSFKALADCEDAITESDETNNAKEASVTVEQTAANWVFLDGFETGTLQNWKVTVSGGVPYAVSQHDKYSGNYALEIGPSSCGADCFETYAVKLELGSATFPKGEYAISCYRREPYDWGGDLKILVNGQEIGATAGLNGNYNQHIDTGWYEVRFSYTGSIDTLVLWESDLTSSESIYLDNISIASVG